MLKRYDGHKVGYDINRITVEFKCGSDFQVHIIHGILIESQWNLNFVKTSFLYHSFSILIESQWNLNLPALLAMYETYGY